MRYARYLVLITGLFLISYKVDAQEFTKSACEVSSPPENCAGLWATQVEILAPKTGKVVNIPNPPCGNAVNQFDYVKEISKAGAAYYMGDPATLANSAGNLGRAIFDDSWNQARSVIGGDVGAAIERNFGQRISYGYCTAIMAIVPSGAEVVGYRTQVRDWRGTNGCGQSDCGWGRFTVMPTVVQESGIKTVSATFINWSHDQDRWPQIIVFYRTIDGKSPNILKSM